MLKRLLSTLYSQPIWKKLVAFFGGLGIITSTIISINQLISQPDKQTNQPSSQLETKNQINKNDNQQSKQKNITIIQQGSQSSYGNYNTNTWNNNNTE